MSFISDITEGEYPSQLRKGYLPMSEYMWAAYVRIGRKWDRVGIDKDRDALLRFLENCFPSRAAKVECLGAENAATPHGWRKA